MSRTWKDKKRETFYPNQKPWYKMSVPSWFKRLNRREERAKQNQAIRENKEVPLFRMRDAAEYW